MSKRVLETLFSSRARVRLLKFMFRNYPKPFTLSEIAKHLQEDRGLVKREIKHLTQIRLLITVRGMKNNGQIKTKV